MSDKKDPLTEVMDTLAMRAEYFGPDHSTTLADLRRMCFGLTALQIKKALQQARRQDWAKYEDPVGWQAVCHRIDDQTFRIAYNNKECRFEHTR